MALILCLCLQSARMQLCRHTQLTAQHLFLQASQSFCAFYFIDILDFFQWVRIMEHFIVGNIWAPTLGNRVQMGGSELLFWKIINKLNFRSEQRPGMVAHSCNASMRGQAGGLHKSQASLGKSETRSQQKQKNGIFF